MGTAPASVRAMTPPVAGAVLCGGQSRRMGGDKAALTIDGVSLLDRVIARLATVAAPVIVASGQRRVARAGCVSVTDAVAGHGPLAGIVASLDASPHELCAVVAVDMPDCDPALLQALAQAWDGQDAVVPLSQRGPEPLHAVYARRSLGVLRAALREQQLALHHVLATMNVVLVDAAAMGASPRFAMNLNAPADVSAWRRDRRERD